MNRKRLSDWILVLSVLAGLYSPAGLAGLLVAVLVRGEFVRFRPQLYHAALAAAACWALYVVSLRGLDSLQGQMPYLVFIWTLPLLMASYRPDGSTVRAFTHLLLVLFTVDLAFNLYSLAIDADVLGRPVDMRSGIFEARHGGLFAHSFYSGAISIAAFVSLMGRAGKARLLLLLLPLGNLLLAGSWRFVVAIPLLVLFWLAWQWRSRVLEVALVGLASLAVVIGVIFTSAFAPLGPENAANSYRVVAWALALEKIMDQPWTGVGMPNPAEIQEKGVSYQSLDDNFIGESSYLNSALSFGVPYAVLFFLAFAFAFWGRGFASRSMQMAIVFPYVIVDMVYGEFFGSVLIYSWLWLLVAANESSASARRAAGFALPEQRRPQNKSSAL